jgi:hypothetical protein
MRGGLGRTVIECRCINAASGDCAGRVPHLAKRDTLQGYDDDDNGLVGEEKIDAPFAKPFKSFGYSCRMSVSSLTLVSGDLDIHRRRYIINIETLIKVTIDLYTTITESPNYKV